MPSSSESERAVVPGQFTPAYVELTQAHLCKYLGGPLRRKDGKVPTRVWVDGDKVLVRFDTPLNFTEATSVKP